MVAPIYIPPKNPGADLHYAIEDLLSGAFDTLICEGVEIERMRRVIVTNGLDCGFWVDGKCAFEVSVTAPLEFTPSGMRWIGSATITARWVGAFAYLNELPTRRRIADLASVLLPARAFPTPTAAEYAADLATLAKR